MIQQLLNMFSNSQSYTSDNFRPSLVFAAERDVPRARMDDVARHRLHHHRYEDLLS